MVEIKIMGIDGSYLVHEIPNPSFNIVELEVAQIGYINKKMIVDENYMKAKIIVGISAFSIVACLLVPALDGWPGLLATGLLLTANGFLFWQYLNGVKYLERKYALGGFKFGQQPAEKNRL